MTGREFLKFFLDINGSKIKEPKTIDEYFTFMDIEEADRDKLMKDYSHGMKNKMQMLVNITRQRWYSALGRTAHFLRRAGGGTDEGPSAPNQKRPHHHLLHPYHGPSGQPL